MEDKCRGEADKCVQSSVNNSCLVVVAICIRSLDLIISLSLLVALFPILVFISIMVFFDTGSVFFTQERVGRNFKTFKIIKFRTMGKHAPEVPTHELDSGLISRLGFILRKSKMDELPQLINVIINEMSLVGPRPCMVSQQNIVALRSKAGIFSMKPGVTGLAQLNRVDMSRPDELVVQDDYLLRNWSVELYLKILFATFLLQKIEVSNEL